MDIYILLPQTNCKLCGEQTCFTFALKLSVGQRQLVDCPVLSGQDYRERLQRLEQLVIDVPTVG